MRGLGRVGVEGRRDGDVCTLADGVDCTTELRCAERTMTETLEPWEAGRTKQTLVAQVARRELVVARPGVLTWGVEGSHAVSRLSILDPQLRTRPPPRDPHERTHARWGRGNELPKGSQNVDVN